MTDIERRHDLPRCPFCGQWPADAGEFFVCCVTPECPMTKAGCVEIDVWQRRPLEREYDADLAHAREAYEYQARTIEQVRLNWPALRELLDSTLADGGRSVGGRGSRAAPGRSGGRGGAAVNDVPCRDAGYMEDEAARVARCNWIACEDGLGLAALGRCSARGDWTDPHCPRFTASQPLGMITRAVLGPDPMEEQP